jgi:hypothetical protein
VCLAPLEMQKKDPPPPSMALVLELMYHFFFVLSPPHWLRYISGGDLFDHILKKGKLPEPEVPHCTAVHATKTLS